MRIAKLHWQQFLPFLLMILAFSAVLGPTLAVNQADLAATKHIRLVSACGVGGSMVLWDPEAIPQESPIYFRALASAAGASSLQFPTRSEWNRDLRTLARFHAQLLIQQGHYQESLPYLRDAQVAPALVYAGHVAGWQGNSSCRMLNWLLAQEIGDGRVPDMVTGWALSEIAQGQAAVVVAGYSVALEYQPNRSDWRLTLAHALLALDREQEAETVLMPLLSSPGAERQAAQTLLASYER